MTESHARVELDRPSFDEFYMTSFARVAGTALGVVRSPEEARDIAQEAFLRTWLQWDRISASDIPILFTLRVARNLSRSALRRVRLFTKFAPLLAPRPDPPPEGRELPDDLMRALHDLPDRQRWAVILSDYCDLQTDVAAKVIGVSPSTFRVHLARARAKLRGVGREDSPAPPSKLSMY